MNSTLPPIRDRFALMVAELIKSPEEIRSGLSLQAVALIHSALGIAGEIGELQDPLVRYRFLAPDNVGNETRDNFLEEAGDFMFYVIDLRRVFMFDERPDLSHHRMPPSFNPVEAVGDVVDAVKRIAIYNKAYTFDDLEPVCLRLLELELWLTHELDSAGLSMDMAMQTVLWKLREGPNARYPQGYSDQAAQDRADKQAAIVTTGSGTCGCGTH